MSLSDLQLDLADLNRLLGSAERPRVKKLLTEEINRLSAEITKTKAQQQQTNTTALRPINKIVNYAWDQSDDFVKLYVTVQGMQSGEDAKVKTEIGENGFSLRIVDVASKDYELTVKSLYSSIDSQRSKTKAKKDMLVVMLRKKSAENWPAVTKKEAEIKEQKKPKFDEKADPNKNLMDMMKNMYDEGDSKMKQQMNKAWFEAEQKRQSGEGDGMPNMAGLGGMGGGMGGMGGGMGGLGGGLGGMGGGMDDIPWGADDS